jgi:small subunit ribosomal protein S2
MKLSFEQILAAGIHIGQPTYKVNPNIVKYTSCVVKGVHILDLVKTRQRMRRAQKFVEMKRRSGVDILFVGTTRQAKEAIRMSAKSTKSFFVTTRWLGGMLTNWPTIRLSLLQLCHLESEYKKGIWGTQKKRKAWLLKRLNRLENYLGGLKGIRGIPGMVILVGQQAEKSALRECQKLRVPVVCRLNTDCDPNLVEIGVPISDTSPRRIRLFLKNLVVGIHRGQRRWLSKTTLKNRTLK